ncbi:MAG TPA: hypothetical protein V6D04_02130, partial [Candidatus Obscuribacterales bacterium]
LVSTGLGGFQSWLASGALLFLLMIAVHRGIEHSPADLMTLLTPALVLAHMVPGEFLSKANWYRESFPTLEWFGWSVSSHWFSVLSFTVLNCGLWSFWAWQGVQRRFRNPHIPLWSKRQSYGLTFCFEALVLGLALQADKSIGGMPPAVAPVGDQSEAYRYLWQAIFANFSMLMILNLLFFLGLIGALLPHRQVVQDWARYRREEATSRRSFAPVALITDLLWQEKSPGVLAIAVNLGIAAVLILVWLFSWSRVEMRHQAIVGLLLSCSMLGVYAVLAQLCLLMSSRKRGMWTLGIVSAAVVMPILVLAILSLEPSKVAGLWLLSAFPVEAVRYASDTEIVLAWLGQLSLISLFSLQLTRQVRQIGASASKALLSDRPPGRASLPGSI